MVSLNVHLLIPVNSAFSLEDYLRDLLKAQDESNICFFQAPQSITSLGQL
jgi:hypothetical protein